MKILVTGGMGFIGSNLIRYWLKKHSGDQIINLDLLTYAGHPESLTDIEKNPRYTFIKGDINDPVLVDNLISQVDAVIHLAAQSHVDRSVLDPGIFVTTNVVGTQTLLEAARKYNTRFHHVSTDEVFGALKLNSRKKFTPDSPYRPNSPYSASKAGSDHLVRAYYSSYGLPVTITNCSNNFGPFQDPEKFIPRAITDLIQGKQVSIYGDGKYVRDWLFVDDHCRAIDLVLHQGRLGETYTVGGLTEDINNLDLIKSILSFMKLPSDKIKFVKDRPGHDRRYAVDWSKIKTELGWKPRKAFDIRLKETVNWYRKNTWWWQPLKETSESIYK